MMLELVIIEASEEVSVHTRPVFAAARSAKMRHHRVRRKRDLPPRVANPPLPVSFLGVHEEVLVKPPRLLEHFAPKHKTRPAHPIDIPLPIVDRKSVV